MIIDHLTLDRESKNVHLALVENGWEASGPPKVLRDENGDYYDVIDVGSIRIELGDVMTITDKSNKSFVNVSSVHFDRMKPSDVVEMVRIIDDMKDRSTVHQFCGCELMDWCRSKTVPVDSWEGRQENRIELHCRIEDTPNSIWTFDFGDIDAAEQRILKMFDDDDAMINRDPSEVNAHQLRRVNKWRECEWIRGQMESISEALDDIHSEIHTLGYNAQPALIGTDPSSYYPTLELETKDSIVYSFILDPFQGDTTLLCQSNHVPLKHVKFKWSGPYSRTMPNDELVRLLSTHLASIFRMLEGESFSVESVCDLVRTGLGDTSIRIYSDRQGRLEVRRDTNRSFDELWLFEWDNFDQIELELLSELYQEYEDE